MNKSAKPAALTIIGALPPPMHGAAQVTALVGELLSKRTLVRYRNTAPASLERGAAYHMRRLGRVLATIGRLVADGYGKGTVYLSAAGGGGVVYDVLIAAVARCLNRPFFIHHHSFAYVDRYDWKRALLFAVAGVHCHHICLCPRMADKLRSHYAPVHRILVLSNAAFYPAAPGAVVRAPDITGPGLVLGHLSNLATDKGLDLVLDTFENCGPAAKRLVLAGAVADAAAEDMLSKARVRFAGRLEERGHVFGEDKARFFADIDVFLFPTRYVNEAEPLVVIEALAAGVPVIAFGRGCIPHMVPADAGLVVPVGGQYLAEAVARIGALDMNRDSLIEARAGAEAAARAAHRRAEPMLEGVLTALTRS